MCEQNENCPGLRKKEGDEKEGREEGRGRGEKWGGERDRKKESGEEERGPLPGPHRPRSSPAGAKAAACAREHLPSSLLQEHQSCVLASPKVASFEAGW